MTKMGVVENDNKRMPAAERKHQQASQKVRTVRRNEQVDLHNFYQGKEEILYGPGITE